RDGTGAISGNLRRDEGGPARILESDPAGAARAPDLGLGGLARTGRHRILRRGSGESAGHRLLAADEHARTCGGCGPRLHPRRDRGDRRALAVGETMHARLPLAAPARSAAAVDGAARRAGEARLHRSKAGPLMLAALLWLLACGTERWQIKTASDANAGSIATRP